MKSRHLFRIVLLFFLSFFLQVEGSRAGKTSHISPVCLPRATWLRTMKQLSNLKDEIAKLRVALAAQEKKMQIANNTQASLLESERLKCHSQIRSLKKCPSPTGCYIALGVTGAVCVGLGIGGYALGRAR